MELKILAPQATTNYVRNPAARFDTSGWLAIGDFEKNLFLLDKFVTDEAAPLTSPRTCEPGPGTLTIIDTGNKLSISGGELLGSRQGDSNPRTFTSIFLRFSGLAVYGVVESDANDNLSIGWKTSSISTIQNHGFLYANGGQVIYDAPPQGITAVNTGESITLSTAYPILLVLLDVGVLYFIKKSTDWELIWPSAFGSDNMLAVFGARTAAGNFAVDNFTIFRLYGDFSTNYGIATSHTAAPATGATGTMTADGFVNFTWTPASAETLELDIRRTDDDNRWVIRCDQAGSTIKLIQREAGAETERASAAQTWTAGTAYTIQARAVGNGIRTFVNSVAKNTYTSATFNNTATGIKVAGFTTGANLAAFPRTLTGDPADEIERQLTWLGL
jgi:hypothetical protein